MKPYPFGMAMPGRKFNASGEYRYGFNGKENDKDISEGGQDYGMRIYDVRLGRFLSVDPLMQKFPMLTPYQFASNTPIQAIDLDGKEALVVTGSVHWFGLVAGYEIGGGLAVSPNGIALYAGQTLKGGLGLELGVAGTAMFFPDMSDLHDLDGRSVGGSFSGGAFEQFGMGAVISSGKIGSTFSIGVGAGAHISADAGFTIGLKVWSWDQLISSIKENTTDGMAIAKAFGIKKENIANVVHIIKDYYKKTTNDLLAQRSLDLEKSINTKTATIKSCEEYLDNYKNLNKISKLFLLKFKLEAESTLSDAKEQLKKDNEEKKKLEVTKKQMETN